MDKLGTPNFGMLFQRIAEALAAPERTRAKRTGRLFSSGECTMRASSIEAIVALRTGCSL